MATHSNILAWKILWTEEPSGLQSMGLQRVGPGEFFRMEEFLGTSVLAVVVGFRRPGKKQASLLGPERARSSKVTGIV